MQHTSYEEFTKLEGGSTFDIVFRHWDIVPMSEADEKYPGIQPRHLRMFTATFGDHFARFNCLVEDAERLGQAIIDWALLTGELLPMWRPGDADCDDLHSMYDFGLFMPKEVVFRVPYAGRWTALEPIDSNRIEPEAAE